MDNIGTVMSNFDHDIDTEKESALVQDSGKVGEYTAYNFFAFVWHDGDQFVCHIRRYRESVEEVTGETLHDIMQEANNKYGWE